MRKIYDNSWYLFYCCLFVVNFLFLTLFFNALLYLNKRDNVCDLVKLKILYPDFLIGSKWLNTMVKLKFSSSLKDLNIHRNIKEWSYLKIKSPYLKYLFNYLIWSFWFIKSDLHVWKISLRQSAENYLIYHYKPKHAETFGDFSKTNSFSIILM